MNIVIYASEYKSKKIDISMERQLETCLKYAMEHNLKIIGTYIDKGTNNTEFVQMMEDSIDENFGAILVYDPHIFADNRYDGAIYKSELKQHGVTLLFTNDDRNTNPAEIIIQSIIENLTDCILNQAIQIAERSHKNDKL